jgi:hypothetical protein
MPIQPLCRLGLNRDKMADRCFFKWAPRVTVTKPPAALSKTGVLSPTHQGRFFNRSFMTTAKARKFKPTADYTD